MPSRDHGSERSGRSRKRKRDAGHGDGTSRHRKDGARQHPMGSGRVGSHSPRSGGAASPYLGGSRHTRGAVSPHSGGSGHSRGAASPHVSSSSSSLSMLNPSSRPPPTQQRGGTPPLQQMHFHRSRDFYTPSFSHSMVPAPQVFHQPPCPYVYLSLTLAHP